MTGNKSVNMHGKTKNVMSCRLHSGSFVLSLAGRDAGRVHVVCSCEGDEYVYIADGRCRTVGKPKKKKRKHLRLLPVSPYRGEMSDRAVCAAVRLAEDDVFDKDRNNKT